MVGAADAAIVVVSGEAEHESHDRQRLGMPTAQLQFLTSLIATKVPLVVCTISGGAVDASLAHEHADAMIAMYTGGMEAGAALADVIFGAVNPSGALAATVYKTSWAKVSDFLSMSMRQPPGRTHRYLQPEAAAAHVLYPFGFGLSYSNWSTSLGALQPAATVSAASLAAGANVTLAVTLRNAGGPSGSRITWVMLTRRAADPAEAWPRQWLPVHGFAKLHRVAHGASATATLTITARDLSRWDEAAHAFKVHLGTFGLQARDGSAPITLTVT
jgi:beta-glucosidase